MIPIISTILGTGDSMFRLMINVAVLIALAMNPQLVTDILTAVAGTGIIQQLWWVYLTLMALWMLNKLWVPITNIAGIILSRIA